MIKFIKSIKETKISQKYIVGLFWSLVRFFFFLYSFSIKSFTSQIFVVEANWIMSIHESCQKFGLQPLLLAMAYEFSDLKPLAGFGQFVC